MNLPNYIVIICDTHGNIIQCPDEIKITKIMDLLHQNSLLEFHSNIKKMFETEQYIYTFKLTLIDNKNYLILNIRSSRVD